MVLSEKQKEDLISAIGDYLGAQGFSSTLEQLRKESGVPMITSGSSNTSSSSSNYSSLLERRWFESPRTIIRLQKRNTELEAQISQLKREYTIDGAALTNGETGGRNREDWMPRGPARLTLYGHTQTVTKVIMHPRFSIIISASEDCSIKIWDEETGELDRTMKGHTDSVQDLSLDPSSANLLASSSADLSIKLWDLSVFKCTRTLNGHDHNVSSVSFLPPGGTHLLSASRDKTVKMWEVSSGFCVHTFHGHSDWVRVVRPTIDGSLFASAGHDQAIRVWNSVATGGNHDRCELRGHEHVIECLAWIPPPASTDSSTEVSTRLLSGGRDKLIKMWDITSSSCLHTFVGHANWVRGLIVHAKLFFSVGDDYALLVWSIKDERCVKSISDAHEHFVTSIDCHPTKAVVTTSSVDKSVKVWDCR